MKIKILFFMLIIAGISIAFNSFNCDKAYAQVGGTLKKMKAIYRMKRIHLNKLYIIQPDLSQYNYKNSGVKAY
ncbi:MAG: hypothetical protein M1276_06025, partial [Deltaproteobacteria bacterium]|nr:hypothetical protein [Deltaproteobacteria bacterium]